MVWRFLIIVSLSCVSVAGAFLSLISGLADDVWRKPATLETLRSALSLAPGNSRIRGSIGRLLASDPNVLNFEESERELQQAVVAAPADFRLWIRLGETLSLAGKFSESELAYKRAVKLAPNHFEPQWRLANLLLSVGKLEEATPYIRCALKLDETKSPAMLDLCWQLSGENASYVSSLTSDSATLQFQYMKLLVRRNKFVEATTHWQSLTEARRRILTSQVRDFINQLIAQKEYAVAWEIWATLPDIKSLNPRKGAVIDGDFRTTPVKKPCFEWKFELDQVGSKLNIDTTGPMPNVNALCVNYSSEGRSLEHASQIILLSPGRYRLSYYSQSKELVSGSLPIVEIVEMGKSDGWRVRSQPALAGSQPWTKNEMLFTVDPGTKAVFLSLRRPSECSTPEGCPIFGKAWFARIAVEPV